MYVIFKARKISKHKKGYKFNLINIGFADLLTQTIANKKPNMFSETFLSFLVH